MAITMLLAAGCPPTETSTTPEPASVTEDPIAQAPPATTASPGVGPTVVTKESMRDALREHVSTLQTCYQAALRTQPRLTGRLDYTIRIGPNGIVTAVTLDEDTLRSMEVTVCARARILQWTFPPVAEETTVSFPVVFTTSPD